MRPKPSGLWEVVRTVVFLLVLALVLHVTARVLRSKEYTAYNSAIYDEDRNSLDVLLMGSSHMLTAVSPLQLWEEHGITSNNLAQNGQVIPVTYYQLLEALRTQTPTLVVLDAYKVIQDSLIDAPASLHYTLDGMRPGMPKLRAAFDLLPEERAEYLVDLIAYHDRWKELTEQDFLPLDTASKGVEVLFSTTPMADFQIFPPEVKEEPAPSAIEYLEKIVDLCRERDISLLLVAVPFATPEDDDMHRQESVNALADYAEDWGVPYINMMHLTGEFGFDYGTDMADIYHVNWRGMEKVTGWLGDYLTEHYDLPDHRGESAYADWDQSAEDFRAYIAENVPKKA
ncbi:MAG: hypothetical protein K2N78_04035 [Oscillospiraceae bacterium]|nr:hypothetical protein [Oscillospiraceae bacterium]